MLDEPLGTIAATGLPPLAASDEELVRGVQERDPRALSTLYDRYSGVLKALIMRIIQDDSEAEDLLQEIYMDVWDQREIYSAEQGKPLGWMVTLTRRRAIDRLRKRESRAGAAERPLRASESPVSWVPNTADGHHELSGMRRTLSAMISALPEAQQRAIELAFFQGMSQREIAAHTNLPLGTIKTHLELGLRKIADGLKGMKDDF